MTENEDRTKCNEFFIPQINNTLEEETNNDHQESSKCLKVWIALKPAESSPKSVTTAIKFITTLIAFIMFMLAVICLVGDAAMPLHGPIFQINALFFTAAFMGKLTSYIKLPPLLGMLITGIIFKNIGFFNIEGVYLRLVSSLRLVALVMILIKAGLGLDGKVLKRMSCLVLRLAFCPCMVEAVTVMFAAKLLLNIPWSWGLLLGVILGAVSPAVVVPSLLHLKSLGYGENKGISTIVIAASSIDDIAAISAFGIILGNIFAHGSSADQIVHGPLEAILGIISGFVYGTLIVYFPNFKQKNAAILRTILIALGGIIAVFGFQKFEYSGAGPLGCIIAAFISANGWRSLSSTASKPVEKNFSVLWQIFQPILFSLIGTEILFSKVQQSTILLGTAVLFSGLLLRVMTVLIITCGSVLNIKERIFVAIAWFPKATVQAALAPVALEAARQKNASSEIIAYAELVLSIAVLSILITAPIGAVGIGISGPKLLNCSQTNDNDTEDE